MTQWEYMRVWLNFYHFETQGPEDTLDIKHNGKLIKSIDISPPDYTEYAWIQWNSAGEQLTKYLNSLGEKGWEIISFENHSSGEMDGLIGSVYLFLKRQKE